MFLDQKQFICIIFETNDVQLPAGYSAALEKRVLEFAVERGVSLMLSAELN